MFVPVLLLTGTAQYLFTPLAMAVVFAMMASYLLSRTLVPTMVHHLLRSEVARLSGRRTRRPRVCSGALHRGMNDLFERLRYRYMGLLDLSLEQPRAGAGRVPAVFARLACAGAAGRPGFLPRRGCRHDAAARAHAAGDAHRADRGSLRRRRAGDPPNMLPAGEIDTILDNIGIPNAWGSLAQGDVPNIAATDGEISDFAQSRASTGRCVTTKSCCASGSARSSRTWCSSSSRPTSRIRF